MMTFHPPLGVHALVWTGTLDPDAVRSSCEGIAEAGFDLLEVPLLDPTEADAAMIRETLDANGLAASCSLGLDFDTDISSTDPQVVEAGAALLRSALQVTVELGSTYLGGPIYSAMAKYTQPATTQGRNNSLSVLREIAAEADAHNITIGLEPVNRYESNLINTVDQALVFIDDLGADNVVVHLDTYHANIEEHDLAEVTRIAAGAQRLGYVHIGESHRGYLGTGTIVWEPFFAALSEVGYNGPIVFESFSSAVVSDRFASALGVWRNLWDESAELTAHAYRFLTEHLAVT